MTIAIKIILITILIRNSNFYEQGGKDTNDLTKTKQANLETDDYEPTPPYFPSLSPYRILNPLQKSYTNKKGQHNIERKKKIKMWKILHLPRANILEMDR